MSEAIDTAEIRKLMEIGHILNRALTKEEFLQIIAIYDKVTARLLEEGYICEAK